MLTSSPYPCGVALQNPRRPAGRPRGAPPNRERILAAARQEFSRLGYSKATIRSIAAAAAVDPALVLHYYGSKAALLAETIKLPFDPVELIPRVLSGRRSDVGRQLIHAFLRAWDGDSEARATLLGLIFSVTDHPDAARVVRDFIENRVLKQVAQRLDVDHPELRASLVASQVIGLALARYVFQFEPLASADEETLVEAYAPTLQRYLLGPLANRRR